MHNRLSFNIRILTSLSFVLFLLPTTLLAQSVPKIFWIDESGTSIKRSNPDGSDIEIVIDGLYYAESMALDPVEERVYWCDEGPGETFKQNAGIYNISSIAMDGSGDVESLPVDYAYCDIDIHIDKDRNIYFSGTSFEESSSAQAEFIPTYSRTDLNGRNEELILSGDIGYVYGLAGDYIYYNNDLNARKNLVTGETDFVLENLDAFGDVVDDTQTGRMYFNTYYNVFHSNYDGSDLVNILDIEGVYNLTIDETSRQIYWDTEGYIYKSDLDGKNASLVLEEYPIDLAFYSPPVVAPVITSSPTTTVMLGESYTYDVDATGTPDPSFSLDTAPSGMQIDANTGVISWTPSELGTVEITVRASNGVQPDATQSFRVTVEGTAPIITSTPVTSIMLGESYTYDIVATGNPAPTFSLGSSPSGMDIDPITGSITWIPASLGEEEVTVRASNGVQPDDIQSFVITVNGTAPIITSTPVTTVMLGESYTYDVEATGNPEPGFELTSSPEGMEIDGLTGVISWTPTELGSFAVSVEAINDVSPNATQSFTVEVIGTASSITSTPVTSVMLGETYTYDVEATGNPLPSYSLDSAPEGMEINSATGVITWTPTSLGSADVSVVASNGVTPDATQSFTVEVIGTASSITSTPVTSIMLGETYTYDVEATGNPLPSYSLDSAPEGMEINSATGEISWTPSALGSVEVTVVASNGVTPDATQSFTVEVIGTASSITSTPVTSVMIGETYTYDVEATGNPLPSFSLDSAPEGMEINSTTGEITWTPSALGSVEVTVVASNGVSPDATQSFTVEVIGTASAITSTPVTSIMLGESYTYDVEATGNPLPSFSLTLAPEGMEINSAIGIITWIPTSLGSYDVTVVASNGVTPNATQSFTVEVIGTASSITSTPVTSVMVGETYSYDVEATGNPLPSYSLESAPEGMDINSATGEISWMPLALGSFDVIVVASNGVTPDATQSFTIEVIGTAPAITSNEITAVMLGETYTYDVEATGNPTPVFSLDTSPDGMEIDPATGVITWTPTALGSSEVTVIASNGVSPDASQSFSVEVTGAEPTITSTEVTTIMLGETYTYDVEAIGNPAPSFALDTAPDGMEIDPATGVITWTPTELGSFDVTVIASNGVSPDATQSFSVEVTGAEPSITSTEITAVVLGESYTYDVEATGNPVPTFALTVNPEGMQIDPDTGVITWTPEALGSYDVTVVASNGVSPDAMQSFSIMVTGAEPTITSTAVTAVILGETYSYDVEATGNPIPTFALSENPEGMEIDESTGVITWTPTEPGSFDVTVVASNGMPPEATQSFSIIVTGAEPTITSTAVTKGVVGETYTYDVEATGNPVPTFSLTENPEDMTIDAESGIITWVPTAIGDYAVTVAATNGMAPDASQSFTITVEELIAPTITSTPEMVATVGMGYEYDVEATGSPVPTFSLTENPDDMTIDSETGLISWTPTADGEFAVTVVASNGVDPEATQSFSITVRLATDTDVEDALVQKFELNQNYPNPFALATTIDYSLATPDQVDLSVYDVLGRHVRILVDKHQAAGAHQVKWDGRDQQGSPLPAGMYFIRMLTQSGESEVLTLTKVD